MKSNTILVSRYTKDTWMKLFPYSSEKTWEDVNIPDSIRDFAYCACPEDNEIPDTIHVFLFSNEYINWLKENKLEHSVDTMNKYINETNDEKALNLLKKYHMDVDFTTACIPFIVANKNGIPQNTNFTLTEKGQKLLLSYMENIYGKDNVCIIPNIMKLNEIYKEEKSIKKIGNMHFNQNIDIYVNEWNKQTFSGNTDVCLLGIPVIINTKADSVYIETSEISFPDILPLAEKNDFDNSETGKEIFSLFDKEYIVELGLNHILLAEDIPDYCTKIGEIIMKK